jgi:hypothetical protein
VSTLATNVDEVPMKDRLQAADASIERQKGIQAANSTLTTALNQLSEGCVQDVQALKSYENIMKRLEKEDQFGRQTRVTRSLTAP